MRIGEIIGKVTLASGHPSLKGRSWKLVVPMQLANLQGNEQPRSEAFVLCDELGAGQGSLVAIAEGPEAAAPFQPEIVPIDAYNAAILDHIDVSK